MQSENTNSKALLVEKFNLAQYKDFIHSCYLDNPKPYTIINNNTEILISGWVLLHTEESTTEAKIIIEGPAGKIETSLNIYRPDVIKKRLKTEPENEPIRVNCGFRITAAFSGEATVSISTNNQFVKLFDIKSINSKLSLTKYSNNWKDFHQGKENSLDGIIMKDKIFFQESLINDLKQNVLTKNFIKKQKESHSHLGNWLEQIISDDFTCTLLEEYISKKTLSLPSPFYKEKRAKCIYSAADKNGSLLLFFKCSSGLLFYIFQVACAANTVYIPSKNKCYHSKNNSSQLNGLINILFQTQSNLKKFKDICYNSNQHLLLGLIISHFRPYHFYYDSAPGFLKLFNSGILNKLNLKLVYTYSGDFASLGKIFSLKHKEVIKTYKSINSEAFNKKGFFLRIATNSLQSAKELAKFDKKLDAYSRKVFDYSDTNYKDILTCYPLIWFGVTSQKRSWLEQIDGIANIINKLNENFPNLGVVFDGWTSPLTPTPLDKQQTQLDQEIINQIKEKIPITIKTVSLVGETSLVKLTYARIIDSYVVNSTTGSIYVSKMLKKPGVGHGSSRMIDIPTTHRFNMDLVDKQNIFDAEEDQGKRADFISYSIDWKIIYQMLLNKLNETQD